METLQTKYNTAAWLIQNADSIIIGAGAGIGVDSGLPDFRGTTGFWAAYPALAKSEIHFEDITSPDAFDDDSTLAWGFYGHRLALYRDTIPHDGFRMLKEMTDSKEHGGFVFTSNVDGHFQKSGFGWDKVVECHGSINHLQCQHRCTNSIWSANEFTPEVDTEQCRLMNDPPRCPKCGRMARPNVMMFGDWSWIDHRTADQYTRIREWRETVKSPVFIELGAGSTIPSVRQYGRELKCPIIRINPTESEVFGENDIGISVGALEGVSGIHEALRRINT